MFWKFTCSFTATKFDRLHYRGLKRCKSRGLRKSNDNVHTKTNPTEKAKCDIRWWKENVDNLHNDITVSNTDIFISKDVSWCGWGAVMESQSAKTIFSTSEKKEHTNILGMKAILFGLKALVKGFTKPHIKVLSDNSTAVACIKNFCTSAQEHS